MAYSRGWFFLSLWSGLSLVLLVLFGYKMFSVNGDSTIFLPGKTSYGHYQIELACSVCHTGSFTNRDEMQQACMNCHKAELDMANDSHPKSKFTDPRNADRVAKLDARYCVTCHVEHRAEITRAMGLTLPNDVCFHCHRDIGKDRITHAGLGFDTCASAGCHNFHDNRALYEDFLLKHATDNEETKPGATVLGRNLLNSLQQDSSYPHATFPIKTLSRKQADAPAEYLQNREDLSGDWLTTAHAEAGVNCSACHRFDLRSAWVDKPDHSICKTCHAEETEGFLGGKHGMRLAQGLPPMMPAMARSKMNIDAAHKELTCNSCHPAHRFDTEFAAVEACISCHDDEHTLAYESSPHYTLWRKEINGNGKKDSGVSCASCHLPRIESHKNGISKTLVQHNQNDTLRPNEKMIRSSCIYCHSLTFSIDALADADLVRSNFSGKPGQNIRSIDMAVENFRRDQERRN